jgi:hypothetical protein
MISAVTRQEAIRRARKSLKFRRWGAVSPKSLDLRYIGESWHSGPDSGFAEEKHHTPAEVAAMWALSVETVRRLFENEPDVMKMPNATGYTGRRRYKTLRIPVSVMQRVHRRISA